MFKNVFIIILLLACIVTVVPLGFLVIDAIVMGFEDSVLGKMVDKIS